MFTVIGPNIRPTPQNDFKISYITRWPLSAISSLTACWRIVNMTATLCGSCAFRAVKSWYIAARSTASIQSRRQTPFHSIYSQRAAFDDGPNVEWRPPAVASDIHDASSTAHQFIRSDNAQHPGDLPIENGR